MTVGADSWRVLPSIHAATCSGSKSMMDGNGAPIEKFRHSSDISPPGVRVADVGGEELQKADLRTITGGGDQDGTDRLRRQNGELGHGVFLA